MILEGSFGAKQEPADEPTSLPTPDDQEVESSAPGLDNVATAERRAALRKQIIEQR